MENLGTTLTSRFPDKDPFSDFIVQDDGDGPYIAHWDEEVMGQKKPTKAQLESWAISAEKEMATKQAKEKAGENIIKALGAKDKLDAVIWQLNGIAENLVEAGVANDKVKAAKKIVDDELGKIQ